MGLDLSSAWDDETWSDEEEADSMELMKILPDISRITLQLLRHTVGLFPEERVAARAARVADLVLKEYGSDGLRLLSVNLATLATVHIEHNAILTRRPLLSLLDDLDDTRRELHKDLPGADKAG
ncbi:hypothetical protein DF268_28555 [Streptomyces sp. V2]|uniref:Uncharacterized protein n=1 Tax=Streptomyces niveiscabiei TaxID=164115 RepID=A0ABW9I3J1_9ACTN|nr:MULTISPECIES: hypothetical protein [Streptomyces]PWG10164.1 hypothetical protein DF268_28555 [Streptomyces sp. V2]QZZ29480.1 hypothetical protein A7X85_27460 [Streptomyces sp. ST1015]